MKTRPLFPPSDDELVDAIRHSAVRRRKLNMRPKRSARDFSNAGLLEWSRHFLPDHFSLPPSAMHVWLADQLDRMSIGKNRLQSAICTTVNASQAAAADITCSLAHA